jgi:hypothetical protein
VLDIMGLFLNPLNMILGGLLISSPIIIHLINRMRFKRVRWAAMEFLLKSQKRSRRKMIIEQLILLLLRILLILLIGLLLARYYNTLTGVGAGTLHMIVLDDSLSMSDRNREDANKVKEERKGKRKHPGFVSCYDRGRDQIAELLDTAGKANSPQEVQVVLLSQTDKEEPIFKEALGDQTMVHLDDTLDLKRPQPTDRQLSILNGIKKANALLQDDTSNRAKVLHIVSDFRDGDWADSKESDEITQELVALAKRGVNISFIDAAADPRKNARGEARWHENLAIVDLRSSSRAVLENTEVEFTVVLENNSLAMKAPNLIVRIDGQDPPDNFASRQLSGISPGQHVEEKFRVLIKRPDSKKPEDAKKPQFCRVSAEILPEENGLTADHIRDVVVQVVERIPLLIVIPDDQDPQSNTNEAYYLKTALSNDRMLVKYQVEVVPAQKLATLDLDKFATVYLLNIHDFDSPVVKKLQAYTSKGGSLAFFLGDKIKDPAFYNEELHKNQKGLFPVLLKSAPEVKPNPEEIADRKQNDPQPKFQFPDAEHPAVKKISKLDDWFFRPVSVNVYYQALPRAQWQADAVEETKELIRLAPRRLTAAYRPYALELIKEIEELTCKGSSARKTDLANRVGPGFDAHAARIDLWTDQVRTALTRKYPYNLGPTLDLLLHERDPKAQEKPDDKEPRKTEQPDLPKFWAATPETRNLAKKLEEFRHQVIFSGDPLLVARNYGKGKVVAWLSSATTRYEWHDYGEGKDFSSTTFLPFVFGLEAYLQNNASEDTALTLSSKPETLERDPALYQEKVKRLFYPQPDLSTNPGAAREVKRVEDTVTMTHHTVAEGSEKGKDMLTWTPEFPEPGVYMFEFTPKNAEIPVDIRALAINVDAGKESNLRRASLERLTTIQTGAGKEAGVGTIRLIEVGDSFEAFKKRDSDLSESPWLYLFFLLILVAEQAMAVHLSYHLKGEGTTAALPAKAA